MADLAGEAGTLPGAAMLPGRAGDAGPADLLPLGSGAGCCSSTCGALARHPHFCTICTTFSQEIPQIPAGIMRGAEVLGDAGWQMPNIQDESYEHREQGDVMGATECQDDSKAAWKRRVSWVRSARVPNATIVCRVMERKELVR